MGRIIDFDNRPYVVRIKCYGPVHDQDQPVDGAYLESWDVEANGGAGAATFTYDADQAHAFRTVEDAMAIWYQQSWIRPLRPDGKKNMPLTAFTAEFVWEPLGRADA